MALSLSSIMRSPDNTEAWTNLWFGKRNHQAGSIDARVRIRQEADLTAVARALHDDLADNAVPARDRDHVAKESTVGVVDLLAPQLAGSYMRDKHVAHAKTGGVNGASTIGG
jgi:hypothetical protein